MANTTALPSLAVLMNTLRGLASQLSQAAGHVIQNECAADRAEAADLASIRGLLDGAGVVVTIAEERLRRVLSDRVAMEPTWIPCGHINDDDAIADAIIRWHDRDRDMRGHAPRDAEFANACWEIPTGTVGCNHPDIPRAERLRVSMPGGNVYVLSIDCEGGGGDDGQRECRYYNVVEYLEGGDLLRSPHAEHEFRQWPCATHRESAQ